MLWDAEKKRAKPLRFKLSSCGHLDMIILTHAIQAGKNSVFLFCLVIEAVKVIAGCACLETGGIKGVSLYLYALG